MLLRSVGNNTKMINRFTNQLSAQKLNGRDVEVIDTRNENQILFNYCYICNGCVHGFAAMLRDWIFVRKTFVRIPTKEEKFSLSPLTSITIAGHLRPKQLHNEPMRHRPLYKNCITAVLP